MRIVSTVVLAAVLAISSFAATKKIVHPKEFPTGRPFSPGILVGDTLYVAGQTGSNLKTGQIPQEFEAEVRQTLDNIGLVLKEAGMTFDNVVAVQVYLTDMDLFQRMNAVYTTYFKEPRPTRTTVGIAKLVGTAKIEITVTASK
jgi:reactive intermediate/imine deaminase